MYKKKCYFYAQEQHKTLMDNIVHIKTVEDYNEYWEIANRHPLVNVLEDSQITHPTPNCRKNFDLYVIFLKDVMCADYLKYGRKVCIIFHEVAFPCLGHFILYVTIGNKPQKRQLVAMANSNGCDGRCKRLN